MAREGPAAAIDAAAAASQGYRLLTLREQRFTYHGRVVEESGWIVLQYWYFYLYNNWRSRFNGANDHEADWEMVCLYLAPGRDDLQPEWVAVASHDSQGEDVRRRGGEPQNSCPNRRYVSALTSSEKPRSTRATSPEERKKRTPPPQLDFQSLTTCFENASSAR